MVKRELPLEVGLRKVPDFLRLKESTPLLACLVSGALLALCLPKPGLCFLAWLAPAVLFWFLKRAGSVRRAALLGGLFGFAYCGVGLNWIFTTCRFAGVPLPVSALAIFSLAAMLCLIWVLFGALARFCVGRLPAWALPWAWALLWTGIESASAHWTPRVGVDLLAYTQWRWLPMIQLGAVLGPHGLAFLIMLWNGALAELLGSLPARTKPWLQLPQVRSLAAAPRAVAPGQ